MRPWPSTAHRLGGSEPCYGRAAAWFCPLCSARPRLHTPLSRHSTPWPRSPRMCATPSQHQPAQPGPHRSASAHAPQTHPAREDTVSRSARGARHPPHPPGAHCSLRGSAGPQRGTWSPRPRLRQRTPHQDLAATAQLSRGHREGGRPRWRTRIAEARDTNPHRRNHRHRHTSPRRSAAAGDSTTSPVQTRRRTTLLLITGIVFRPRGFSWPADDWAQGPEPGRRWHRRGGMHPMTTLMYALSGAAIGLGLVPRAGQTHCPPRHPREALAAPRRPPAPHPGPARGVHRAAGAPPVSILGGARLPQPRPAPQPPCVPASDTDNELAPASTTRPRRLPLVTMLAPGSR